MELTNEFQVGIPVSEAWKVLTDVERIAPLLPGAQLQEVEGEEYRGIVKVKVGPITAQYKGSASFVERDEQGGRVVLKASGRDTRGQGNASATITATMTPEGEGTRVKVVTDLTVTGKVAQFGRGVLADVSNKLMGQFVQALEADLAKGGRSNGAGGGAQVSGGNGTSASTIPTGAASAAESAGTAATGGAATSPEGGPAPRKEAASTAGGVRKIESPEPEPVDLIEAAGGSVMKRVLPALAGAGALGGLVWLWWRRRSRRKASRAATLAAKLASEARGHLPSIPEVHVPSLPSLPSLSLPSLPSLPEVHLAPRHRRRRSALPRLRRR
jgi:carbon monoxide dehydrogenase subunit G